MSRSGVGGLAVAALLAAGVPAAVGERLPVTAFTAADGLGHDHVRCAVRDRHGLLWFCTATGIARFDGVELTPYGPEDGLPSARVNDLLEGDPEREGEVYWLATERGLYAFDVGGGRPDRPRFAPVAGGCAERGVDDLLRDAAGNLWAGCDEGLFRLRSDGRRSALERVNATAPAGDVRALAEDPAGGLWAGGGRGLARLGTDGGAVGEVTVWRTPPGRGGVRTLAADAGGRLWVGFEHGLGVVDPERTGNTVRPHPGSIDRERRTVRSLFEAADGTLWVGTVGALFALIGGDERRYTVEEGLSDETVNALVEDRAGSLWLGTDVGGVIRWLPDGLVSYGRRDGLAHASVSALIAGRDGQLYVGADSRGGISRLDGDRFTGVIPRFPESYRPLMRQGHAHPLQDRTGAWWLASSHGLFRFPPTDRFEDLARVTPRRFGAADGLTAERVLFGAEDSVGDLWFATAEGPAGALSRRRSAGGRFEALGADVGLPPSGRPTALLESPPGSFWVGWSDGALLRGDGERFEPTGLRASAAVWDLLHDAAGRLWVATNGDGVYRLDEPEAAAPTWRRYGRTEGLSTAAARCLTADRWGRIYIGGVRGIDRLDPGSGRVRRFTTADGLAQLEVTAARAGSDGALWFGTFAGLSRLVPRREPPPPAPRVRLAALRVDGREIPVSPLGERRLGPLHLPSGRHRVEVGFFAVGSAPGTPPLYRYRLAGGDWGASGPQRDLVLADVGPGVHRLEVTAVAGPEEEVVEPATVVLAVAAPLWRRGWFVALAALGVVAAAIALHRLRVRRALGLERVRTRIAADLHDDLGAGLSRISLLAEAARTQAGAGAPPLGGTLTQIAGTARDLAAKAREIVWSLDPRYDDLASFAVRVREVALELLEPAEIACSLAPPGEEAGRIRLDPEQRQHLLLVFKEAIHNVVRHAGASRVELAIEVRGRRLAGEIRDDGRGLGHGGEDRRPDDDRPPGASGHGLDNMRGRIARLGGRFEAGPVPGGGTRVAFEVPLGRRAGRGRLA